MRLTLAPGGTFTLTGTPGARYADLVDLPAPGGGTWVLRAAAQYSRSEVELDSPGGVSDLYVRGLPWSPTLFLRVGDADGDERYVFSKEGT